MEITEKSSVCSIKFQTFGSDQINKNQVQMHKCWHAVPRISFSDKQQNQTPLSIITYIPYWDTDQIWHEKSGKVESWCLIFDLPRICNSSLSRFILLVTLAVPVHMRCCAEENQMWMPRVFFSTLALSVSNIWQCFYFGHVEMLMHRSGSTFCDQNSDSKYVSEKGKEIFILPDSSTLFKFLNRLILDCSEMRCERERKEKRWRWDSERGKAQYV